MSNETVLTDEQIEDAAWDNRMENSRAEISATAFKYARAIEQAVLKSPEIQALRKDAERLDWLADPNNSIGNVQLPTECVTENLHSLRAAIDDAMEKQT
jgi:hypothetical protein